MPVADRRTSCALLDKSQRAGCVFHTLPVPSFYLTGVCQAAARRTSLREAQCCRLHARLDVKIVLTFTTTDLFSGAGTWDIFIIPFWKWESLSVTGTWLSLYSSAWRQPTKRCRFENQRDFLGVCKWANINESMILHKKCGWYLFHRIVVRMEVTRLEFTNWNLL